MEMYECMVVGVMEDLKGVRRENQPAWSLMVRKLMDWWTKLQVGQNYRQISGSVIEHSHPLHSRIKQHCKCVACIKYYCPTLIAEHYYGH